MEDMEEKGKGNRKKPAASVGRKMSCDVPLTSVEEFFAGMETSGTEPVSETVKEDTVETSVSVEDVKVPSGAASRSSRRSCRPSGGGAVRPSSVSVSPDVMAALSLFVRMYNASNPGTHIGVREFVDRALVKSMKRTSSEIYAKVSEFLGGGKKDA